MKSGYQVIILQIAAFGALLALTACGGNAGTAVTRNPASSPSTQAPFNAPDPLPELPGTTDTGTNTGTASVGTSPIYMKTVSGMGYDDVVQIEVPVRKVLKVQITPEQNDAPAIKEGGFVPTYSKLAVFAKVGSLEQPTHLMDTGTVSGNKESSTILDFSLSFTKTCAVSDTLCRQNVVLSISRPNSDARCYMWGLFCSYEKQLATYGWKVTVKIQTDDTEALQ